MTHHIFPNTPPRYLAGARGWCRCGAVAEIIAIHRKFQTRRVAEDSTWLYGEATQHRMRLSVDGYMAMLTGASVR